MASIPAPVAGPGGSIFVTGGDSAARYLISVEDAGLTDVVAQGWQFPDFVRNEGFLTSKGIPIITKVRFPGLQFTFAPEIPRPTTPPNEGPRPREPTPTTTGNPTVNWGNLPPLRIEWGTPPALSGNMTHDNVTGHLTVDQITGRLSVDDVTGKLYMDGGSIKVDPITANVQLIAPTEMPDVKMIYEGALPDITLKYDGPTEFVHRFENTDFKIKYEGAPDGTVKQGEGSPFTVSAGDLTVDLQELYRELGFYQGQAHAMTYALNKENLMRALESYFEQAIDAMKDTARYSGHQDIEKHVKEMTIEFAKAIPSIEAELAKKFNIYGKEAVYDGAR